MTRPRRIRISHVERLLKSLSARDIAVLETLARVHVASGTQLERLHFADLGTRSRSVKRGQVLKRLAEAGAVIPFERRIGTAGGGSEKSCYALDSAGLRVLRLRANENGGVPVRRPRVPGERFTKHALAITELYVSLIERSRVGNFTLAVFDVEPRWPNGLDGWLAPDAYVRIDVGAEQYAWWFEADMGTEDLQTTIRGKLADYMDFVERGGLGPNDVVPWVLFGVPTPRRQRAVQMLVNHLPELAGFLFRIGLLPECTSLMEQELVT